MKLSNQDKRDMRMDGQSDDRRKRLKAVAPGRFCSLEEYLSALDDLLSLRPTSAARLSPTFTNIRL